MAEFDKIYNDLEQLEREMLENEGYKYEIPFEARVRAICFALGLMKRQQTSIKYFRARIRNLQKKINQFPNE